MTNSDTTNSDMTNSDMTGGDMTGGDGAHKGDRAKPDPVDDPQGVKASGREGAGDGRAAQRLDAPGFGPTARARDGPALPQVAADSDAPGGAQNGLQNGLQDGLQKAGLGAAVADGATLSDAALAQMMPMFLRLDAEGTVRSVGPTLCKLLLPSDPVGRPVTRVIDLRRPRRIRGGADLAELAGARLAAVLCDRPDVDLRGTVVPLAGGGLLLDLALGIGAVAAVGGLNLTVTDFAATDQTSDILYLVEANSAVMAAWRRLNHRLEGDKIAAEVRAETDPLTGLKNRRALELALSQLTAGDLHRAVALMQVDLDRFKLVNDTLGHAAGDRVLKHVATVLMAETRSIDLAARVGGDEFLLLLRDSPGLEKLCAIADRIIAALERPVEFDGAPCMVSASVGIALSSLYDRPDPDRMLGDVDKALYAAKHAGRGRFSVHRPDASDAGGGKGSEADARPDDVGEAVVADADKTADDEPVDKDTGT